MSIQIRPRVTTFELDEKAYEVLGQLQRDLQEKTKVGVVRKALALLSVAVEVSGSEGYFVLKSPNGEETKVRLV